MRSVAGKTFPAFPAHAQPAMLRIWQAHVGRGENVPGIFGAWATHNFTYLARDPFKKNMKIFQPNRNLQFKPDAQNILRIHLAV